MMREQTAFSSPPLRAAVALALFAAGCSWGVGESLGYLAARHEASARAQHADAAEIEALCEPLPEDERKAVSEMVERIKVRAVDDARCARIEQEANPFPPEKPVELRSTEDDEEVEVAAGTFRARNIRRRRVAEFGEKAAGVVGRIIKTVVRNVIPAWMLWLVRGLAAGVAIFFALSVAMWIKKRFYRSAAVEMVALANERIPKSDLAVTRGSPAQKVYRQARDAGVLGKGGGE